MSRYVPSEGAADAKILLVGEAPGREEESQGRPFIGRSGELLTRYLERHGVLREDVFLTNLCKYRPANNSFKKLLDTEELEESLAELEQEIEEVDPTVIVALGGWPLYYLTGHSGASPGTGITNWRGSILPSLERWGERKVVATYHPAYILRVWGLNPVFHYDLGKAVKESEFPELNYPAYESYIDPDPDDLRRLVSDASESDWISVDIETFPTGSFSCIGFTHSDDLGVCVTFQRPDLHHFLKEMWECPAPKIFQYGTYDISFMRYFYSWQVGGYYDGLGWDTYVASANLLPDFPRGLDFLTSLYTRFPYYKEERKVWKEQGDMTMLWEYNIKDIITTYQIAMKQMEEMRELYT